MAGNSTVVIDTSGQGRVRRARITTGKRMVALIIGVTLFGGLVKLIISLRAAGRHIVQAERPLRAGSVYNLRLSRGESRVTSILVNDADFPATAGESYRFVNMIGRAKIMNIDPRGIPNRIIIKIETLRQVINSNSEQTLITDSGDIGITRRVGGVFEVASKQPLDAQTESALTFVLRSFMRPIPGNISLNAILDAKTERKIEDRWQLAATELKLLGDYLIGGSVSEASGVAELPRRELVGIMPCVVLNLKAEFAGLHVPVPAGFRLFQPETFRVTMAQRLPLDPERPVITRSSTTVMEGRGTPPGSQHARLSLVVRIETTEDVR